MYVCMYVCLYLCMYVCLYVFMYVGMTRMFQCACLISNKHSEIVFLGSVSLWSRPQSTYNSADPDMLHAYMNSWSIITFRTCIHEQLASSLLCNCFAC